MNSITQNLQTAIQILETPRICQNRQAIDVPKVQSLVKELLKELFLVSSQNGAINFLEQDLGEVKGVACEKCGQKVRLVMDANGHYDFRCC